MQGIDEHQPRDVCAKLLSVGHGVQTAQGVRDEDQRGAHPRSLQQRMEIPGDRAGVALIVCRVAGEDAGATVAAGPSRAGDRVLHARPIQRPSRGESALEHDRG